MLRQVVVLVLLTPVFLLAGTAAHSEDEVPVEDLVIVTEDSAITRPGCDAASVHDVRDGAALYRGATQISPGRLAVGPDLELTLATWTNQGWGALRTDLEESSPFIYVLKHNPEQPPDRGFKTGVFVRRDIAVQGGIAILPDKKHFLVGTSAIERPIGSRPLFRNVAPHYVRKFTLPDTRSRAVNLGRDEGAFKLEAAAAEIVLTNDGAQAHVLTTRPVVHSIDTSSMAPVANPIPVKPVEAMPTKVHTDPIAYMHADRSTDGRYLVSNRGVGEINVADLKARQSWTLSTAPVITRTGGVALNKGWINRGLLAVHGIDRVAVFRFDPHGPLEPLSYISIPPTTIGGFDPDNTGPLAAIAWSTRGDYLIAASVVERAQFTTIKVADDGRTLRLLNEITACPGGRRGNPNDIVTANGLIAPSPTPTATDTPTATPTATSTASPTLTPTATPTATPRPSSTLTPTARPKPIYLPVTLSESCQPELAHTDVVLVIDASTTMLEPTRAGRPKIEAARDAARGLVDLLDGPDQAAIVWFNETAAVEQPLTDDARLLSAALDRIAPREFTRIDLGVAAAHRELASPRRRAANQPAMIVLTDGRSNPVPAQLAVDRAAEAKADGTLIFTVGVGSELDFDALERMASQPRFFYRAPDAEQLAEIYAAIEGEIPCPAGAFWGGR